MALRIYPVGRDLFRSALTTISPGVLLPYFGVEGVEGRELVPVRHTREAIVKFDS